jgi:hypothetical protein
LGDVGYVADRGEASHRRDYAWLPPDARFAAEFTLTLQGWRRAASNPLSCGWSAGPHTRAADNLASLSARSEAG